MTTLFQGAAQFQIVINFAVEDHLHHAIFVGNRLMTAGNVNNTQAAHPQSNPIGDKKTFVVWPTMDNRIGHALQQALHGWR